jgi:NAD(P)-dependent dehydrogenase (short-subunit alcohol dehydrogenase family)
LLRSDLVTIISRGQAALPFVSFLSGICDLHPRLRAINTGNRLLPPFGGILNTPINGSYCVAKHAMESLGEVYRRELFMYGIDVVSIQPGPIQSEISNSSGGNRFPEWLFCHME